MCWNDCVHGGGGRGAGLKSLICCQFSWFWALVAPAPSSEQESPVPPSCVLGFSVPALKLLYILWGLSLAASSMFCLDWPRFTKWSLYACHTEINQVFSMESQFDSHFSACRCLFTGSVLVQESTKQKAVGGQWTPHIPGVVHQHVPRSLWSWGCWQQTCAWRYQIQN